MAVLCDQSAYLINTLTAQLSSAQSSRRASSVCIFLLSFFSQVATAGGGYFALGYGHTGKQMAGAVTAVAGDAYAGASNPARLTRAGDQMEIGIEFLNPNRRVEQKCATAPASIYNFSTTSRNSVYVVPDFAFSRQVDEGLALGVAVFANGGLNSEYTKTTGVQGSNSNPEACGDRPGNFITGCGNHPWP